MGKEKRKKKEEEEEYVLLSVKCVYANGHQSSLNGDVKWNSIAIDMRATQNPIHEQRASEREWSFGGGRAKKSVSPTVISHVCKHTTA